MLLVLSGAIDGTCDRVMSILENRAFRFNYDIFHEYEVSISPSGWKVSNPAGLTISSDLSTGAFWWKPFNYGLQIDKYVSSEVRYIFRELYAWHLRRGLVKGNPPDYHNLKGKLYFLEEASKHFLIPDSFVGWGFKSIPAGFSGLPTVAKSLSSEPTSDKKALFTTEVDSSRLDPNYPWFLQTKIEASHDITVFVCGNKKFCFEKSRDKLRSVDWRLDIDFDSPVKDDWEMIEFTNTEKESLDNFCIQADIHWGRIDFMRSNEGRLYFLEFNANGQWVFLDYERKNSLVEHVCEYLLSQNNI